MKTPGGMLEDKGRCANCDQPHVTVLSPLGRVTCWPRETGPFALRPQTYGPKWDHGETEGPALAAVPLVCFHFTASCEAKTSCWGHMLAGSARPARSSRVLCSNGNSTACPVTAQGLSLHAADGASSDETRTSQHLARGNPGESAVHATEADPGLST